MPHSPTRPTRRVICAALLVLPLVAGCAANRVSSHEANPEYSGKTLRSLMEKDIGPAVDKYVALVFRTMVADKVI